MFVIKVPVGPLVCNFPPMLSFLQITGQGNDPFCDAFVSQYNDGTLMAVCW